LAVAANTWTDISANQTFRVDNAGSIVEISCMGTGLLGATGVLAAEFSSRLVIDSAGTPINKKIGGEQQESTGGAFQNPISGAQPVKISGLAVGNHTVKLQFRSTAAATAYLRASSTPETEHLNIQVTEYQNA
jgi:hypothetical protein